jgi:hypothetical protein
MPRNACAFISGPILFFFPLPAARRLLPAFFTGA